MLNVRFINYKNCFRVKVLSCRSAVTRADVKESLHSQEPTNKAKLYKDLPGPTKWEMFKAFLPGGSLKDKSIVDMHLHLRNTYGDIFLIPGLFGKRNIVTSYNPKDYEMVFRTEGAHPKRLGLDALPYYRKVLRSDLFKDSGGLMAEQGESWWSFRSAVNPVMMNPKSTILYAPKMNKVADEFVEHIRKIRDKQTHEAPDNFINDLNHLAFEYVCLVALDKELGMITNSENNPMAKKVIDSMKEFFELILLLDVLPSVYKFLPTKPFKRFVQIMDDITNLTSYYIDEALERLEQDKQKGVPPKPEHEQSILERLVNIDRSKAIVMAMDLLMSGVDTTTSAMSGVLLSLSTNPEKQNKLREEINQILPDKNSPMTSEKLKNLPYLRACIKEGFRMYPTVVGNFRTTGQNVELSGYQIPEDTNIAMPIQLLMRDPKYFQRPLEYLPERWLRNTESEDGSGCPLNAKEPFIFLPFGFGPRNCIGKRLVDLEIEITVAKLIRNFELRFDYPTENMYKSHVMNVPNKPLKFKFIDIEN